jgi:hypothetical protein
MNIPILAITNADLKAPLVVLIVCAVVVLAIWDGVWKLIALWKSARNGQLAWFVFLAILNTAGILPILYLWLFQKKQPAPPAPA